jgi:predicted nucleic acid-binding protein
VIAVDTTILVYAVGIDHPLRDPCRSLVRAVGDGRISATTTVEVIQEFTHVRARRRGRADAARRGLEYAVLFGPLLRPDGDDLARGLELFAAHERLGASDAVLAATVQRDDRIAGLASADAEFGSVNGLVHLDAGAPDFLDRLGAGA